MSYATERQLVQLGFYGEGLGCDWRLLSEAFTDSLDNLKRGYGEDIGISTCIIFNHLPIIYGFAKVDTAYPTQQGGFFIQKGLLVEQPGDVICAVDSFTYVRRAFAAGDYVEDTPEFKFMRESAVEYWSDKPPWTQQMLVEFIAETLASVLSVATEEVILLADANRSPLRGKLDRTQMRKMIVTGDAVVDNLMARGFHGGKHVYLTEHAA